MQSTNKEPSGKVKYCDIIKKTPKATLFLFNKREIWVPNKLFSYLKGQYISIPHFIAKEKGLDIKLLYHTPEKIEPVFNQEPINDLVL